MKKSFIKVAAAALTLAACVFAFASCNQTTDTPTGDEETTVDDGTIISKSTATLTVDSSDATGLKTQFNDENKTAITTGQTITVKYTRPAIAKDWASHFLQVYAADSDWTCKASWIAVYPSKDSATITLTFTAEDDFNLGAIILGIQQPNDTEDATDLEITDLSVVVSD